MTTETLEDAFRGLCEDFGISLDSVTSSADEDAQLYLDPEDPDYVLAPFVLVTHAGEFTYLKCYGSFNAAVACAFENASDDIYAEFPSQIVNLENGAVFVPCWDEVPWKRCD